jgi:hypothetical protein
VRIPALLISQFDAVITWIGDHDRVFNCADSFYLQNGHCGSAVEQQKSTSSASKATSAAV